STRDGHRGSSGEECHIAAAKVFDQGLHEGMHAAFKACDCGSCLGRPAAGGRWRAFPAGCISGTPPLGRVSGARALGRDRGGKGAVLPEPVPKARGHHVDVEQSRVGRVDAAHHR
ncbi:hypothetical protein, partial [Escherichia coli]|uniref:hypothetical protein n=1 Tax=Escherichia coli TaxID=562 RepID=UPI0032E51737